MPYRMTQRSRITSANLSDARCRSQERIASARVVEHTEARAVRVDYQDERTCLGRKIDEVFVEPLKVIRTQSPFYNLGLGESFVWYGQEPAARGSPRRPWAPGALRSKPATTLAGC